MKKLLTAMAAVLIVISLAACSGGDETVVKTDSGDVTKKEFYNELKKMPQAKSLLRQMVYVEILNDRYEVSKEEIQQQLEDLKKQLNGEQGLKMFMMRQGIQDKDELKEKIKQSLLFFKATTEGIEISDKQIKEYYNKHKTDQFTKIKVSHILVDKKAAAETILKKLKNGEDFAELAKKRSKDPGSSKKGGDLGYITRNTNFVQPFLEAAFKLDVGEVSEPVKSRHGYHIIKVTDKKVVPLKEVKDKIKKTLLSKQAKPISEVFNELNKDVEVQDEAFKDLFKYEAPQKDSGEKQGGKSSSEENEKPEKGNNNSDKQQGDKQEQENK